MNLLFAMLPIYVLGNVHCLGMCGPIAMLIGHSSYRAFYLLGRVVSFTLAGTLAGALGEVLGALLESYHLSGILSLLVGLIIFSSGLYVMINRPSAFTYYFTKKLAPLHDALNQLLMSQEPWPLFLVGFLTILLPCGQTLLVYSACALSGSALVGTLNGFVFGLLTTPSLYLAMQAKELQRLMKLGYRPIVGGVATFVGLLAILRGFAELGFIPHMGMHPFILY